MYKLISIIMKRKSSNLRNYIFVIILGLILSACSKDDPPASENIVGTWTTVSGIYTAMIGEMTLTDYFIDVMELTEEEAEAVTEYFNLLMQEGFSGTIQLKSDKTYTSTLGGDPDSGTWSLSSDGKKLTIDSATDDPFTLDVIELTSDKLILEIVETIEEDLNGDDIPEEITVTIEMTFNK